MKAICLDGYRSAGAALEHFRTAIMRSSKIIILSRGLARINANKHIFKSAFICFIGGLHS